MEIQEASHLLEKLTGPVERNDILGSFKVWVVAGSGSQQLTYCDSINSRKILT